MKKIFFSVLFITLFFVISISSVSANEISSFHYSVSTSDEEWKSFTAKSDMIEALRIPQEVLETLTTLELVELVFDFPMIIDLHLYNSINDALKSFELECDAYRELLNRPEALKVLENYSVKFDSNSFEKVTSDILLDSEIVITSELEVMTLLVYPIYGTVYTPNGSSVSVIEFEEYPQWYLDDIEDWVTITYPNATFVSSATRKYNCHSYAWYSSSTSNTWWMNDPSAYMSDGSYTRVYSALQASRVYYPVGDHSMLIYDAYGRALSTATVISKWGPGPVMIHDPYYSPYNTSGYKLYI